MDPTPADTVPPEHNVTGIDYDQRSHFRYDGPVVDIHAHVLRTSPNDPKTGPPTGTGTSLEQAAIMLHVAEEFGVTRIYSMCPPDDIPPLRERFGDRLGFNGAAEPGYGVLRASPGRRRRTSLAGRVKRRASRSAKGTSTSDAKPLGPMTM